MVPQTLSYLLMRSMHESVTAASVKRVYAMREALVVLDWDDEDSEALKVGYLWAIVGACVLTVLRTGGPLPVLVAWEDERVEAANPSHPVALCPHLVSQGILAQCFITPVFLSTTEGQRFCSYVMCLQYVCTPTTKVLPPDTSLTCTPSPCPRRPPFSVQPRHDQAHPQHNQINLAALPLLALLRLRRGNACCRLCFAGLGLPFSCVLTPLPMQLDLLSRLAQRHGSLPRGP